MRSACLPNIPLGALFWGPKGANPDRRFACAFTLGSGLIMASFFALKGFKAQAAHMLDKDRLLFSMGAPAPLVLPSQTPQTCDAGLYAQSSRVLTYSTLMTHDAHLTPILALAFCAGYVGSMGATLYAALVMHSYIMSLICCAVQVRLVTPL